KQRLGASYKRMLALRQGQYRSVLLSSVVLWASVPTLMFAAQRIWQVLAYGVSPGLDFESDSDPSWWPGSHFMLAQPIFWTIFWCVCGFLTVARFLGYLDIRT